MTSQDQRNTENPITKKLAEVKARKEKVGETEVKVAVRAGEARVEAAVRGEGLLSRIYRGIAGKPKEETSGESDQTTG